MTTRYFKATNGIKTVFRASKTRVYRSAEIRPRSTSFSMLEHQFGHGLMPATEIDKEEYDALVQAKARRAAAIWKSHHQDGAPMPKAYMNSPQDSWVYNTAIEGDRT